jgi:hypothetical protein
VGNNSKYNREYYQKNKDKLLKYDEKIRDIIPMGNQIMQKSSVPSKFFEKNFNWKEVNDLAEREAESRMSGAEENIESVVKNDYKEGHLKEAILSRSEIMLSGRSYTGVRYDYLPYVLRYIEVHGSKKPTQHMFDSAMIGLDIKKFPNNLHLSKEIIRNRLSKATLAAIDISDLKK